MATGCCCHYDEGYEEGFDDGVKEGKKTLPAGGEPLHAAYLLEAASRALYRADPLSLLALDCQQAADVIAQEMLTPGQGEWDHARVRLAVA